MRVVCRKTAFELREVPRISNTLTATTLTGLGTPMKQCIQPHHKEVAALLAQLLQEAKPTAETRLHSSPSGVAGQIQEVEEQ